MHMALDERSSVYSIDLRVLCVVMVYLLHTVCTH